jgi:hypothetical protein
MDALNFRMPSVIPQYYGLDGGNSSLGGSAPSGGGSVGSNLPVPEPEDEYDPSGSDMDMPTGGSFGDAPPSGGSGSLGGEAGEDPPSGGGGVPSGGWEAGNDVGSPDDGDGLPTSTSPPSGDWVPSYAGGGGAYDEEGKDEGSNSITNGLPSNDSNIANTGSVISGGGGGGSMSAPKKKATAKKKSPILLGLAALIGGYFLIS